MHQFAFARQVAALGVSLESQREPHDRLGGDDRVAGEPAEQPLLIQREVTPAGSIPLSPIDSSSTLSRAASSASEAATRSSTFHCRVGGAMVAVTVVATIGPLSHVQAPGQRVRAVPGTSTCPLERWSPSYTGIPFIERRHVGAVK